MINETIEKFLDFDEQDKNEAWAAEMARLVMRDAVEVISVTEYEARKNILYGAFPDAELDKIFTSASMRRYKTKLSKSTVYFFERIRNALIAERAGNDSNLTITVNSLDPEKEDKKQFDKSLLQNRKGIEGLLNDITANNGMPPQKVTGADYNGNVDEFDKMGGDDLDPGDVNNFFDAAWGLLSELYLQNPLNAIFRLNQVKDNYNKYITDILIDLKVFSQVYVDETDGSIKTERLAPYNVKVLHATGSDNYKDAQGFHLPQTTNIRGFMKRFGNNFNFDRDWSLLLNAVSGGITTSYSGISHNNQLLYGQQGTLIEFSVFLDKPIAFDYTEFKTIGRVASQLIVTPDGNIRPRRIDPQLPAVNGAPVKKIFYEDTYYTYSFNTGSSGGQKPQLIKWGKLYMQQLEGMNDEYSGFSIKGNGQEGVPVALILQPLHQIIQVSFKMMEMLINDIKPDGLIFTYSSIIQVANYLKSAKDVPNDKRDGIEAFVQMVEESPNLLVDTPLSDDGAPLGGGNMAVQTRKNGINAATADLIKIMDWCEKKAGVYLGTEGIEFAEARDGFKLSVENKKRSRAATAFIDNILLNHLEDISISVLNCVQDIAKFKDIPAYKYLVALAGQKAMDFIGKFKKSPHRYGIFLDTFNNDVTLMEIRGMAQDARLRNEISLAQYLVLMSFENPKQASIYLTRETEKAKAERQKNMLSAQQQQDAAEERKLAREIKLQDLKGKWSSDGSQKQANGFITAAQINAKSAIVREQLQQEGQNKRLADEAVNEIDKIAEQANAAAQKPLI